ncbi:MAG: cytochrome c maturation protein CcmE [Gammaproteobacteria bacterium]|nr:MAG: cytochrome c maturation protein CcmE [Gammaproteobacteria bacterium]
MNPHRRKLLITATFIVVGVAAATLLGLKAFQENLLYFYSPSQIAAGEAPLTRSFRAGGLVVEGSVTRDPESLIVQFVLTDTIENITVVYDGILPDLFREGQGIVANGNLQADGKFEAFEVLAKHDENYMPPEVADALTKAGVDMSSGKGHLQQ